MTLERLNQILDNYFTKEPMLSRIISRQEEKEILALAKWAVQHAEPALTDYKYEPSRGKGTTQFSSAAEALARFPKGAQ